MVRSICGGALVVLFAVAIAPFGCANGDTPGCKSYWAAVCDRFATCQGPLFTAFLFNDVDTCAERESLLCGARLSLPDENATDDALGACAKDVAAMSCDDWKTNNLASSSCAVVEDLDLPTIPGLRPDYAACVDDFQCASGVCQQNDVFQCGLCAHVGKLHEDCTTAENQCATGFFCGYDDASMQSASCYALIQAGDMCLGGGCALGLACVDGTCGAPRAEGVDCQTDAECDVASGDFCDPTSEICAPYSVPYWGGKCSAQEPYCHAGFFCNVDARACQPSLADGASCLQPNACTIPARCVDSTCSVPTPAVCSGGSGGSSSE